MEIGRKGRGEGGEVGWVVIFKKDGEREKDDGEEGKEEAKEEKVEGEEEGDEEKEKEERKKHEEGWGGTGEDGREIRV